MYPHEWIRDAAKEMQAGERGKAHTVALVACARKLLIFANTVVARGTPWEERQGEA